METDQVSLEVLDDHIMLRRTGILITTTSLNSYGKVLSSISKIKKSYELQKEKRSLLNYSPEENNNFNQNFSNLPNKILQGNLHFNPHLKLTNHFPWFQIK